MQEIDPHYALGKDKMPQRRSRLRRFVAIYYVLLALVLLALIPPYISVNRYQRRIATSIGQSLGRPVHLDHVTLNLLPLPGFTLENLVVSEDPAFGNEPVIRANSVHVRLRVSSLWSRQVEFSTISFTEPSLNLVRLADGKWNLDSILLQAARIDAAPTAQKNAGSTPRFPYIEATGARVNLKLGDEKIPLALTDSEFALWLPNPQEWRVRIEAQPARTDTNASDTGTVRIEGTLARATSLNDVPIHLEAEWIGAPLGEATRVLLGRDEGLRGEMTLTAKVLGTVGSSNIQTRLQLNAVRRADFVPEQPLSIDLECLAKATEAFHAFSGIQCSWPPSNLPSVPTLILSGTIPDVRRLETASMKIEAKGISAGTMLDWMHVASARVPPDVSAQGSLTGSVAYRPEALPGARWEGLIRVSGVTLQSPLSGLSPLTIGDAQVQSPVSAQELPQRGRSHVRTTQGAPEESFLLAPTSLALGGKDPAVIDGRIDESGYKLHLAGTVILSQLIALGNAIPPLGDGMQEVLPTNHTADPVRVDLTATRAWGGVQVWQDVTPHPTIPHARSIHR